jgi:hypothetical protein
MPFMPPMGEKPPIVREQITAGRLPAGTDMSLVTQLGQSVIHGMAGQIHHFFLAQRQNHRLSGLAVRRTHITIPPLDLMYEVGHGCEVLTISCVVTPELLASSFTEDINLDGYFAYYYDASQVRGPAGVDLYMNGVKFHNVPLTVGVPCGTIICAFGPTALKCHSLNDARNQNQKKLYPPVTPALPNVNGFPQIPGYFALNWADPRSPIGDVFNNESLAPTLAASPGGVGFKVIQCSVKPDSAGSVVVPSFNPTGPNLFEAYIGGNVGSTNIRNAGCFAEFFDRTKTRLVSQSWHKRDDAGASTILVNDTPMYNGSGGYQDASTGTGLYVDLSLKAAPPLTSTSDAEAALTKIVGLQGRLLSGDPLRRASESFVVQNRTLTIPPAGTVISAAYTQPYTVNLYWPSDLTTYSDLGGGGYTGTIQYVQAYYYTQTLVSDPALGVYGVELISVPHPIPGQSWAVFVPNGMTLAQAESSVYNWLMR